jgi:hypothetical protein
MTLLKGVAAPAAQRSEKLICFSAVNHPAIRRKRSCRPLAAMDETIPSSVAGGGKIVFEKRSKSSAE